MNVVLSIAFSFHPYVAVNLVLLTIAPKEVIFHPLCALCLAYAPRFPEKPSGPPRLLLAFGGAFLGFLFASLWIYGEQNWAEDEPHRLLLVELSRSVADDWARLRSRLTRSVSKENTSSSLSN
jgi:drug/metabolite transporter (DMT)-like permease